MRSARHKKRKDNIIPGENKVYLHLTGSKSKTQYHRNHFAVELKNQIKLACRSLPHL